MTVRQKTKTSAKSVPVINVTARVPLAKGKKNTPKVTQKSAPKDSKVKGEIK
jgi:hypothetical protein